MSTIADFEKKLEAGLSNLQQSSDKAIQMAEKGEQVTTELKTEIENAKGELQRVVDQIRDLEEKSGGLQGRDQAKGLMQLIGDSAEYKSFKSREKEGAAIELGGDELKAALEQKALVTTTSSGLLVPTIDQSISLLPRNEFVLRSLIPSIQVSNSAFEYFQEKSPLALNAGMVAEGGRKPETSLGFEKKTESVKKIAVWIPITEEAAADLPQLMGYVNELLRYDIKYKEEEQILKGDGTGDNLNGLMTQATAYDPTKMKAKAGDTMLDTVRRMIAQVRVQSKRPADFISMSEMDWLDAELMKDDKGNYMFASIQGMTTPILWGRPVAVSDAMDDAVGEVLVGHSRGATIYDRLSLLVKLGRINDDFIKNQFVVLAEERLGLGVRVPHAFVKHQMTPESGG